MKNESRALLRVVSYRQIDITTPRCENGITLREMARKIGIDASNLSKYERGLLPLQEDVYEKIQKALTYEKMQDKGYKIVQPSPPEPEICTACLQKQNTGYDTLKHICKLSPSEPCEKCVSIAQDSDGNQAKITDWHCSHHPKITEQQLDELVGDLGCVNCNLGLRECSKTRWSDTNPCRVGATEHDQHAIGLADLYEKVRKE